MKLQKTILALAAMTTGLTAGLFFGYQVSVIPAFKTLSDAEYIAAMQAINIAIQNPTFELNFLGPAILLPIAAYLHRSTPASLPFKLLVVATLLYIVGALGITFGANIPLNDKLAEFSLSSSTPAQALAARTAFEDPWNTWHILRTLASIGSFILAIIACFSPSAAHLKPIAKKS